MRFDKDSLACYPVRFEAGIADMYISMICSCSRTAWIVKAHAVGTS